MFHTLVLTIHILACIFLIVAVLLQAGKGADIGAVFGGVAARPCSAAPDRWTS